MERNKIREKSKEQVNRLKSAERKVTKIINNSSEISKLYKIKIYQEGLEKIIKNLEQPSQGIRERYNELLKVNNAKENFARKLTEIINLIIDYAPSSKKLEQVSTDCLELEKILNDLGFELFSLPTGSKYDYNLDSLYSEVINNNSIKTDKKDLFISKSSMGCVSSKVNGIGKKIIKKAHIELTSNESSLLEKNKI